MQTSLHNRVIVLCERLAEATLADEIDWRVADQDRFAWEDEAGSVVIGASDRDGLPPYELAIVNSLGEKVEELVSALLEEDQPAPWNEPLAELYRAARRSALHADEIIDALVAALPHDVEDADEEAVGADRPDE
jgi:hypothetical protein